jgi:hypothetical protein
VTVAALLPAEALTVAKKHTKPKWSPLYISQRNLEKASAEITRLETLLREARVIMEAVVCLDGDFDNRHDAWLAATTEFVPGGCCPKCDSEICICGLGSAPAGSEIDTAAEPKP